MLNYTLSAVQLDQSFFFQSTVSIQEFDLEGGNVQRLSSKEALTWVHVIYSTFLDRK